MRSFLSDARHYGNFDVLYGTWLKKGRVQSLLFCLAILAMFFPCWVISRADKIATSEIQSMLWDGLTVPCTVVFTLNGCAVTAPMLVSPGDMIIRNDSISMNGLILSPSLTSPLNFTFALPFVLRTSYDRGQSWSIAASSDFRWTNGGVRFFERNTSANRDNVYDFRPPWPWYIQNVLIGILVGLAFITEAVRERLKWPIAGTTCFLCICAALSFSYGVVSFGYIKGGSVKDTYLPTVYCGLFAVLLMARKFAKLMMEEAFASFGFGLLAMRVLADCWVFEDCSNLMANPPARELLSLAFGVAVFSIKWHFCIRSWNALQADRAEREERWNTFLAEDDNRSTLQKLEQFICNMSGDLSEGGARHYNRQTVADQQKLQDLNDFFAHCHRRFIEFLAPEPAEEGLYLKDFGTIPGTSDLSRPAGSLDQLYSQALGIIAILSRKSSQWAAVSNGLLDAIHTQNYGHDDQVSQHRLEYWIRRRYVKSPVRAISKVKLCYDGDCSRLVDVCRVRIFFDNMTDIHTCLEAIISDKHCVKIRRIKNSMKSSQKTELTAGFRAIVLNICIVDKATKMLGVENHVCEVQLHLKRLCSLEEDAEQHQRYLKFRSARANFFRMSQCVTEYVAKKTIMIEPEPLVLGKGTKEMIDSHESPSECPTIFFTRSPSSGDGYSPQLTKTLLKMFVRANLQAPGSLERQRKDMSRALRFASASSVWFTSDPLAAGMTKRTYQLIFATVAVFFSLQVWLGFKGFQAGSFQASSLRFKVMGIRNATWPLSSANMTSFGLLQGDCMVRPERLRLCPENSSFTADFKDVIHANGYYFTTAEDSPQLDPINWILEASTGSDQWIQVGASLWRFAYCGKCHLYSTQPFPVPEARNHTVQIDYRRSWLWALGSLIGNFTSAVTLFAIAIMGAVGRPGLVSPVTGSMFAFRTLSNCIAAIGFHWRDLWRDAVERWLFVPEILVLTVGILLFRPYFASVLLIYSIFGIIDKTIYVFSLYEVDYFYFLGDSSLGIYVVASVFSVLLRIFRVSALSRARKLILSDQSRYDHIWRQMAYDRRERAGLEKVKREVMLLRTLQVQTVSRQMNPPNQSTEMFYENMNSICSGEGERVTVARGALPMARSRDVLISGVPIDNLEQLLAQASCLEPMLIEKVKTWASMSKGCFPVKESTGIKFMRFADIKEEDQRMIKWCKIKSIPRTIEKVVRSYSQDVSRLTDLCRQSITFNCTEDIASCLRALNSDHEVRVLRVKNRLDEDYDAQSSAGYRDVALNLQIDTKETRQLGLYTHICEVQLLMRSFAEVKSQEGHKRYVAFRNLKAE